MKPLKALLFHEDGSCAQVFVRDFNDISKFLDCDIWTVCYRKFDEIVCSIYLDDCGKLRENPKVTAVNCSFSDYLVGNLLICKSGDAGEDVSFTEDEIAKLYSCITDIRTWNGKSWDTHTVIMYD